jgi:hypothetical protein
MTETTPSLKELLDWLSEIKPDVATGHTSAYSSYMIFHIRCRLEGKAKWKKQ